MTEAPGYRTLTGPGIVCMIVSAGLLATSDGVVKWLADGYPISQIIVLRGAFILLPMFILAWRMGKLGSCADSIPYIISHLFQHLMMHMMMVSYKISYKK